MTWKLLEERPWEWGCTQRTIFCLSWHQMKGIANDTNFILCSFLDWYVLISTFTLHLKLATCIHKLPIFNNTELEHKPEILFGCLDSFFSINYLFIQGTYFCCQDFRRFCTKDHWWQSFERESSWLSWSFATFYCFLWKEKSNRSIYFHAFPEKTVKAFLSKCDTPDIECWKQ